MKHTFLYRLLPLILLNFASAQTMEEIVEENIPRFCSCIEQLDYIDSIVDFELKLTACSQLNASDSIRIKKAGDFDEYTKSLFSSLNQNCAALRTKIDAITASYQDGGFDYTQEESYPELEKQLLGRYSLSFGSRQPDEGRPSLFLYHQNKFVMASFGEIRVGTWRVVRGKYLHLNPSKPEKPFEVYARYNPEQKDTTKTTFIGNDFDELTLLHYGKILAEKPNLTPIFNKDANCFRYPFQAKIAGTYEAISLAYDGQSDFLPSENEIDLYAFQNPKRFNEFVIYEFTKSQNLKPTRVLIEADKLIFGPEQESSRKALPDPDSEDDVFLKSLNKEHETPNRVYYNLGFKEFDPKTIHSDRYTYDAKKNAYIANITCPGRCPKADDYSYSLQVQGYERLEDVQVAKKSFTRGEKSLIYSVCEE